MPVLIAGIVGDQPDSLDRVTRGLMGMNSGGLEHHVSTLVMDGCTLGRISIFPDFERPSKLQEISESDTGALVGDFRLYDEEKLSNFDVTNAEDENALSARWEEDLDTITWSQWHDLNGDFAAARWDKNSQQLTLLRDQIGVRPLCYCPTAGQLFFASLPSGLCNMTGVLTAKQNFLAKHLLQTDAPLLPVEGHEMVPAGGRVEFSQNGGLLIEKTCVKESTTAKNLPFESACEKLAELLSESVKMRISSFQKTSSHLSGGLDSSSVGVTAARLLESRGDRLIGLTFKSHLEAGVDSRRSEFLRVQNLVQIEGGIDLLTARPSPKDESIENEDSFVGSLFSSQMMYGEGRLASLATSRRSDVVLSGLGGDQFASASGFSAISEMFIKFQWLKLWRLLSDLKRQRGSPMLRTLLYHLKIRLLSEATDELRGQIHSLLTNNETITSRKKPAWQETKRREQDWLKRPLDRDLLELAHIGAHTGVRYAFPLLDPRIIDFVQSLPAEYFVKDGHTRALMRGAMEGVLPDEMRLDPFKRLVQTLPMTQVVSQKEDYLAYADSPDFSAACKFWGVHGRKLVKVIENLPSLEEAAEMDNNEIQDAEAIAAVVVIDAVRAMDHLLDKAG